MNILLKLIGHSIVLVSTLRIGTILIYLFNTMGTIRTFLENNLSYACVMVLAIENGRNGKMNNVKLCYDYV